jgi:hypothetical protein
MEGLFSGLVIRDDEASGLTFNALMFDAWMFRLRTMLTRRMSTCGFRSSPRCGCYELAYKPERGVRGEKG